MSVFKRGEIFWYEFMFHGQRIRESTGSPSMTLARRAERKRRQELEEGANHLTADRKPLLFSTAGKMYLEENPHWSDSNQRIERYNVDHLTDFFGRFLLTDIAPGDIKRYQAKRIAAGASPRTCNLEIGTLRAILRKARLWANIQPDVKMLTVSDDVGQALTHEQESQLLEECVKSRSRSLHPAVTLALSTAMRYSEIRLLRWKQLDFGNRRVWVGKSKTRYGDGRPIPMNDRAFKVLSMWAEAFPQRQPEDFVFPAEKYGAAGDNFTPCVYGTDPTNPVGDWKEAWEKAKERAKVVCRFHDLRHTACTRMLESGTPLSVVATLMGWSPSTAVRMSRRYGHIGQAAQVEAVQALNGPVAGSSSGVPTKLPTGEEQLEGESSQDVEGIGSSARTRTWNPSVNSRMLYH